MYFIFDLDGTLLNDNHQISRRNLKWIKELKSQGYKLGINTGRPMENIHQIFSKEITSFFDVISSYNGGWNNFNGIDYKNPIDKYFLNKFIEKYNNAKFTISISVGNVLYTNDVNGSQDIIERLNLKDIKPLEDINNHDVYVIRLIDKDFNESKKTFAMMKDVKNSHNVVMSTGIFVLITNKKSSKINQINMIHALNEKVVYFGDSHNDLPVFEMADVFTVAPSNAFKDVKKMADLVLDKSNNETLTFNFKNIL